MGVNLSIKNAPEHVVAALRDRARRNHLSLQGELLAIVEADVAHPVPESIDSVLAKIEALRLQSPSESTEIVRQMRDSRYGDEGL